MLVKQTEEERNTSDLSFSFSFSPGRQKTRLDGLSRHHHHWVDSTLEPNKFIQKMIERGDKFKKFESYKTVIQKKGGKMKVFLGTPYFIFSTSTLTQQIHAFIFGTTFFLLLLYLSLA